ncbi:hypothetical protein FA13DRAFT_1789055 [Coprinellus micaceus]|uniref:Uncharacterized protein n=1 Tax=Coprinellus micaceus TaxID=71717 RepID=A0A4Y7TKF6_COPMI|nr:hypothetical protein FA13DRAFT_1789055 [Coprinellus micaceus]
MASTLAPSPPPAMLPAGDSVTAQRPPSIRSVASSTCSSASGVSLSRKPRIRPRSRTVTGASTVPIARPLEVEVPDLPYLGVDLVQEPSPIRNSESEGESRLAEKQPAMPQLQPRRPSDGPEQDAQSSGTSSTHNSDLGGVETTFVGSQLSPELKDGKTPTKATFAESLQSTSSLPPPSTHSHPAASPQAIPVRTHHARYNSPPSAFSRDPTLPNVRDSVSTHVSGTTSSSLYPLSTSYSSNRQSSGTAPESPEPPSPRSMSYSEGDIHHIPRNHLEGLKGEMINAQEFDGDDVAYRLQLLVRNNYFLPPAHSKPSPSDFAPSLPSKKPSKSFSKPPTPTAGFLDLFRGAKSKSKPTTPTGSPHLDAPAPMLRATSDSITTGAHGQSRQHGQSKSPGQSPRTLSRPASRGRVVVVREKMQDIAVAAKQAEQDLKTKGAQPHYTAQPPVRDVFDPTDVIDPTDAVDVPLPSASYPFAVQASALHGLGVQESLGAAVLADRLPPPRSPDMSGMESSFNMSLFGGVMDEAENGWRKLLLHQAVQNSYDTTPNHTPDISMSLSTAAGLRNMASFEHNISSFDQKKMLGISTPAESPAPRRRRAKSAAPSPDAKNRRGGVFEDPDIVELVQPLPSLPGHRRSTSKGDSQLASQENGSKAIPSPVPFPPSSSSSPSAPQQSQNAIGKRPATGGSLAVPDRTVSADSRTSSYIPPRVDTPSSPPTPLSPPPRRQPFAQTLQSTSHTDLPSQPHGALRRVHSSPMLADTEPITRRQASHPPLPSPLHSRAYPEPLQLDSHPSSRIVSTRTTMSFDTIRDSHGGMSAAPSIYSDDEIMYEDGAVPRRSLALSAVMGRPSMSQSEYSQSSASPTTSAFQEALNGPGWHTSRSSLRSRSQLSLHQEDTLVHRELSDASAPAPRRDETMSPPPRVSSSLAHFPSLPAPPNRGRGRHAPSAFPQSFGSSSSFPNSQQPRPFNVRTQSIDSTTTTEPDQEEAQTIEFTEPEPTTPPVPFSDLPQSPRSQDLHPRSLTLDLPRRPPFVENPQPSPTAFFDSVETQPNALDELESSDEESEDGDQLNEMQARARVHPPPSFLSQDSPSRSRVNSTASAPVPRSHLGMKFTNNSAPYVSASRSPPPLPMPLPTPVGIGAIGQQSNLKLRQPVGNNPKQGKYFADRARSDGESALDFYRLKRPGTSASTPNSSSSGNSLASGIVGAGLLAGGLGAMGGSGSLTPGTASARASEETRLSLDPGRPSFAGTVSSVGTASSARSEEVRKLDGMLRDHMEAEKEQIKRIATEMKVGRGATGTRSAGSTPTVPPTVPSGLKQVQLPPPEVLVTEEPEEVEMASLGSS